MGMRLIRQQMAVALTAFSAQTVGELRSVSSWPLQLNGRKCSPKTPEDFPVGWSADLRCRSDHKIGAKSISSFSSGGSVWPNPLEIVQFRLSSDPHGFQVGRSFLEDFLYNFIFERKFHGTTNEILSNYFNRNLITLFLNVINFKNEFNSNQLH